MSTVLIACERETEQQLLDQVLSGRGYRVLKSRDGIEALEMLRSEMPSLVLANVVLPKMDGFALFRKCKQDERLQQLPFIFYSPRHSDPKYERFAMELGAKGFLQGTIKAERVLTAVDEVFAAVKQAAVAQLNPAPAKVAESVPAADPLQVRQQLAERLQELESLQEKLADTARFSRLFELNPAAMWLVDKGSQKMLAVNEAALAIYGYTRTEFLAMSAGDLFGGGEATTFGSTAVIAHRHKDGRVLSLMTLSRDMDFDGRAVELVVAHDFSYRVRAERKVVDEAQRLRNVFAALPDGYCVVDADGRHVEVNERYCQLTGYGREELLRMTTAELQSQPADAATARYQAKFKRKDGTEWQADVSSASVEGSSGRRMQLVRPLIQAETAPTPAVHPEERLSLIADLLNRAEQVDEKTLLAQLAPQLAQVFDSPVGIVALGDKRLRQVRVQAMSEYGHPAGAAGVAIELPQSWSAALDADAMFIDNESKGASPFAGLNESKRYLAAGTSFGEQESLLFVVANRETAYVDSDKSDFSALTDLLSGLLARKRVNSKTLAGLQRAELSVQAMVDLLCRLIDQHDPHTAGSSNRLAGLAVAIARSLGLGGEQQHTIYLAARLHDLGNIAIPKEILARPQLLDEYEMALVRTHAEQGAKLLAGIDLGGDVAEVVRQHHERLNGSGYPRALKNEQITIEARIIAVADVVEAMCSPRPHRRALGLDAALAEIAAGSGTLYDPKIVEICTRVFGEGFDWPR